jgi:FixJ family two-component response regulator
MQPTVHVVDDDAEFRRSVTRLLKLSGYEIAHYENADQLLEQLPDCGPGCILLDLNMPKQNGLQLQARLAELAADLPIVFLTGRGDIASSVKALKAGAEDFLCKPVSKQALFDALERAIARDRQTRENRAQLENLRERLNKLTPREKQVYALVVTGKLNKQIAYELSATERTIKAHRQKVMHKLQARSVVELVAFSDRVVTLAGPLQRHAPAPECAAAR